MCKDTNQEQIDNLIPYQSSSLKEFPERENNNNMIYAIMSTEDNRIIGYMKDENARDYFVNRPKNQNKNQNKYYYTKIRYMEEIEKQIPKREPVYLIVYIYTYEAGLHRDLAEPIIVNFSNQRVFDIKKTFKENGCIEFIVTYTGIIDQEELKEKLLKEVAL